MKVKYPILGYAPGAYSCKCTLCKDEYMGDKRSFHCEPCAINTLNESHKRLNKEYNKLVDDFNTIKKTIKIIKHQGSDCDEIFENAARIEQSNTDQ